MTPREKALWLQQLIIDAGAEAQLIKQSDCYGVKGNNYVIYTSESNFPSVYLSVVNQQYNASGNYDLTIPDDVRSLVGGVMTYSSRPAVILS